MTTNTSGGPYNDSLNEQIRKDGLVMDAERAEFLEAENHGLKITFADGCSLKKLTWKCLKCYDTGSVQIDDRGYEFPCNCNAKLERGLKL